MMVSFIVALVVAVAVAVGIALFMNRKQVGLPEAVEEESPGVQFAHIEDASHNVITTPAVPVKKAPAPKPSTPPRKASAPRPRLTKRSAPVRRSSPPPAYNDGGVNTAALFLATQSYHHTDSDSRSEDCAPSDSGSSSSSYDSGYSSSSYDSGYSSSSYDSGSSSSYDGGSSSCDSGSSF